MLKMMCFFSKKNCFCPLTAAQDELPPAPLDVPSCGEQNVLLPDARTIYLRFRRIVYTSKR